MSQLSEESQFQSTAKCPDGKRRVVQDFVSDVQSPQSPNQCRVEVQDPNMWPSSSRLRRYGVLTIVLLLGIWTVYLRHYRLQPKTGQLEQPPTGGTAEQEEQAALDESVFRRPMGAYTAHIQPEFAGIVLVQALNTSLLPQPIESVPSDEEWEEMQKKRKRLIIIGDVHGMKTSLEELLGKVGFDKETDHLILAGDMISKGPDSTGVLDIAMELGASAVRGNHEDHVLLAYDGLFSKLDEMDIDRKGNDVERDVRLAKLQSFSHSSKQNDRLLAKQLKRKHVRWLKKLPVILYVGPIRGMGQVIVVHAGLVPGVDLHRQDPYYVMNMRTIDLKTHIPSNQRDGTVWTKLWNHYQSALAAHQRSTVIYGHDSKRGLSIGKYTKGLDTGCHRGGELTALIIEPSREGDKGMGQRIVSVDCTI